MCFTVFHLTTSAQFFVTIGPSVAFNPNIGLNKILRDFNDMPEAKEKFGIKTYSFGLAGTVDAQLDGGSLSVFNFNYERSTLDGMYEDSLDSYSYHAYRVLTSFGVMNVTRGSSSGWFIKLEPLCFGRQKMRLTVSHYDKVSLATSENVFKAIWTTTLSPQWTPGIGIGRDMGILRIYLGARTVVRRTPQSLPGYIKLNNSDYSNRVGYFSLALHVQLKLGGN
jgi:hypothetical protein